MNNIIEKDGKKMVKIRKNIVIGMVADSVGCGHLRCIFPLNYLNAVFGKEQIINPVISPFFIRQQDILVRTRTIFFQRQMTVNHLNIVREYKALQPKLKYKMVYDMDDMIWDYNEEQGGNQYTGIPSYNFAADRISEEMKQSSIEIMKHMDIITVSTDYLKDYITKLTGGTVQVVALYNAIPKYLYKTKDKEITEDIKKPKILYNGSPTHYSNLRRMCGDITENWRNWIIDSVNKNKISFSVMGGLPWFLECIKDKIYVSEWVNTYDYPMEMKKIEPDFVISPLTYNEFNSSKSDIKYIESAAVGAAHIGTVFSNGKVSPYDNNVLKVMDNCSEKDIDDLVFECCNKDKYNDVLQKQYYVLEKNGRFMESSEYINKLVRII